MITFVSISSLLGRMLSARFANYRAQRLFSVVLIAALTFALPQVSLAVIINFAPGDYDNTQNQVNAGPTPVNNQTTGFFRDIFWWGSANGVGDKDYINSGKNLISNGGSPQRAVVGGDDDALNFTGVGIPNGGKSFMTIYDTTPANGTTTRNLFNFSQPGGVTVSADVLFSPGNHTADAGVVALFSEGQDALILAAHNGAGNNADVPKLSLIFQSNGAGNVNGTVLTSTSLADTSFLGDTNPGLLPAQAVGPTSGDHWYRVIMNVAVNGDAWTETGSFWTHTDPTDPDSPLGVKITDLNFAGSLSNPGNSLDLTNPGQVGLYAANYGGLGDGCGAGCDPANPLVDNVGVSITNFDPGIIPEPTTLSLMVLANLGLVLRRFGR